MMEVFNPSGATGATLPFAPRLGTLDGKKIGLLSNEIWQANRTHPLLHETLKERFPTAQFVHVRPGDQIQADAVIASIVEQGFDAVIVGNAA